MKLLYCLNEAVMDKEVTQLSRKIVNAIKHKLRFSNSESSIKRNLVMRLEDLRIKLNVNVFKVNQRNVSMEGGYNKSTDTILFKIFINSPDNRLISNDFIYKLKSILTHELKHRYKHKKNQLSKRTYDPDKVLKGDPSHIYMYLTNKSEMEAITASAFRKAKMKKVPYIKMLNNILNKFKNKLNDRHYQKIKNDYIIYSKKMQYIKG